ncbi:MAG: hypothetical protein WKF59_24515 [Chitinophagaceae bacterium]
MNILHAHFTNGTQILVTVPNYAAIDGMAASLNKKKQFILIIIGTFLRTHYANYLIKISLSCTNLILECIINGIQN